MLVDLHAHYPMHVRPTDPMAASLRLWSKRGRTSFVDRFDAALIGAASRLWNHESATSGPRVTVDGLRQGEVGVALSVLCTPLLETGNRMTKRYRRKPPYGAPPEDRYLDVLLRQLSAVEARVKRHHRGKARIARCPSDLDAALSNEELALVHCVEGGFSLGASPQAVERAVRILAGRGVAYITIAHLFWRHIATNVPSIPGISDEHYNWIFPQPEIGLSELGEIAIRAMVAEGVLVDITHMSAASIEDTLELMDEIDPARSVPLIASHSGFRFGRNEYNLSASTISRIAERDGVVGLIFSPHFMGDGLPNGKPETWAQSFEVFSRHVDEIRSICGSFRNIALGSDLDGFIKPTLTGLEHARHLGRLAPALEDRYGASEASAIQSDNALRVLRAGWRGAPG